LAAVVGARKLLWFDSEAPENFEEARFPLSILIGKINVLIGKINDRN